MRRRVTSERGAEAWWREGRVVGQAVQQWQVETTVSIKHMCSEETENRLGSNVRAPRLRRSIQS